MQNKKEQLEEIQNVLFSIFGHDSFRSSLQERATEAVAEGSRDVYISFPTGGGKSLCYQLPVLLNHRKGIAIVVSPLIALMCNQLEHLKSLGVLAKTLNSTLSKTERERVIGDLKSKEPQMKLLYITPEQAATKTFKDIYDVMVRNHNVCYVAVDEAHCVSQWGHDFRPDYLRLGDLRKSHSSVQWVALTATASVKVMDDIFGLLHLKQPVAIFKTSCFRSNLFYDVIFKECVENSFDNLRTFAFNSLGFEWENEEGKSRGCGIVYCRTREACEEVSNRLTELGLLTKPYHAGLKPDVRTTTQNEWMTGKVPVIAATVSFGMGVDKASVRFVAHWTPAQSVSGYYQESGRAGRDGKRSYCRIYYSRRDRDSISFLLQRDSQSAKNDREGNKAKQAIMKFDSMIRYCEQSSCRHSIFAKEFGDEFKNCKRCCDVCAKPKMVEQKLREFQNSLVRKNTTLEYRSKAVDHELYEGGKVGTKKNWSTGSDDDSSGETGENYDKKASHELQNLIKKEFQKRKNGGSSTSKQKYSTSRKNVLEPKNNSIPEVTLTIRDKYTKMLEQEMLSHYNACEHKKNLTTRDIKMYASEKELEVYKVRRNIHMYRKEFADLFKSLRDATRRLEIHPLFSKYDPLEVKESMDCRKVQPKQKLCTLLDFVNKSKNLEESSIPLGTPVEQPQTTAEEDALSEKWEAAKRNLLSCPAIPLEWQQDRSSNFMTSDSPDDESGDGKDVKVDALLKSKPMIQYFFESLESVSEETKNASTDDSTPSSVNQCPIPQIELYSFANERQAASNKNSHSKSSPSNNHVDAKRMKFDDRSISSNSSSMRSSVPPLNVVRQQTQMEKPPCDLKTAADYLRRYLDPMYREKRLDKDSFKLVCKKLSHKLVNSGDVSSVAAKRVVHALFKKYPHVTPKIVASL